MGQKNLMVISSAEQLLEGRTRREFLKLVGLGGAVVFLPSVITSCNDSDNGITGPPAAVVRSLSTLRRATPRSSTCLRARTAGGGFLH